MEFYRIYRIYRIERRLLLVIFIFKITKNSLKKLENSLEDLFYNFQFSTNSRFCRTQFGKNLNNNYAALYLQCLCLCQKGNIRKMFSPGLLSHPLY